MRWASLIRSTCLTCGVALTIRACLGTCSASKYLKTCQMSSPELTIYQIDSSARELKLILKAKKDISSVLFPNQPVLLTGMAFSRLTTGCIVAKLSTVISQMEEKLAPAENKEYSNWLTVKAKPMGLSLRKSRDIQNKG